MSLRVESDLSGTESRASAPAEAIPAAASAETAEPIASAPAEVTNEPVASSETIGAEVAPLAVVAKPADPVDRIKVIQDPTERARALLDLAHASGGGARFEDGLTIVSNGKLWRALVDQMRLDQGGILKLLENSFISSSYVEKIVGDVLDEPPTPFETPDPISSNRMVCRQGLTQADAIDWLCAPLTGATVYWGNRDRTALRSRLLRELADELASPAVGAGARGFSRAWLRRSDGSLLVVDRAA